ncbi:ENOS interacting protein [Xylariaceae sp. FL1272]|nr:ENOS interacting protein [Xylariaceae sp. FL1272]
MSHSKRNTSRAVFTSYERDLARQAWSNTSARLTRESFLSFSACRLCLATAIDPVSCTHGDIFCRECALSNILAQKNEIKRLEKIKEQEDRDAAEAKIDQDAEAHERAVREFERTQNGLDVQSRSGSQRNTPNSREETDSDDKRPKKRKFEMDAEELARIATEDRAKARKAIDDEKASKPVLPSFWAPSITPSSNTRDTLHEVVKKTKTTPICPASAADAPHTYSLHTLVSVKFATDENEDGAKGGGKEKDRLVCPACKKTLSNSSKAVLAKPCGHVLCGSCVEKFMKSNKTHHDPHAAQTESELRCYVCEADLTDKPEKSGKEKNGKKKKDKDRIRPGLVELRSEGTGYSASGKNQVVKSGVAAFQC